MESKIILENLINRTIRPVGVTWLLLLGLLASVAARLVFSGNAGVHSVAAGIFFGTALVVLSISSGRLNFNISRKTALLGVFGAAALCLPVFISNLNNNPTGHPLGDYGHWALVVSVVAIAEEIFFRGALYEAVTKWKGEGLAILITSLAFSLMHVPFYGWHILLLDLVVGLWLGILRYISGSIAAPATAHTLSNLVGWWII